MPYDEELAARIRQILIRTIAITERKMFGGLAFMCHGKMCCGIVGQDLMVRVLEKDMSSALQQAHVRPMDFTGKPLRGFVYVAPAGVATENSLRQWVRRGISFVKTRRSTDPRPPVARLKTNAPLASNRRPLPFDRVAPVQHSREVVRLIRQSAAIVALLTLAVGNVAVCAGWQATPEARMACCMNGTTCPMHKSDSHQPSSTRMLSQAQADSCCAAASQGRESAAAGSTFAASGVIALAPVAVFTVPSIAFASQEWRALNPLPVSSTPKHLLLSVFLV